MDLREEWQQFREGGAMLLLKERTKLLFTGTDRVRYLNGQLTANVAKLAVPGIMPTCVTTAKGRLCAVGYVSAGPSGMLIDAEAAVRESLAARLERYIVADDVQMEDATERVEIVHFAGVDRERLPEPLRERVLPNARLGVAGWDWFPPFREQRDVYWQELQRLFPMMSEGLAEQLRILHGVPRWGMDVDENTLPAEAGFDRTHVDFHKGCYIGQEVISRVRSVGHVNREWRGFLLDSALPPGSWVFSADEPARDLGRLTSVAHGFALDRPVALGYLRRGTAETGLLAASPETPDAPVRICTHPLPFLAL